MGSIPLWRFFYSIPYTMLLLLFILLCDRISIQERRRGMQTSRISMRKNPVLARYRFWARFSDHLLCRSFSLLDALSYLELRCYINPSLHSIISSRIDIWTWSANNLPELDGRLSIESFQKINYKRFRKSDLEEQRVIHNQLKLKGNRLCELLLSWNDIGFLTWYVRSKQYRKTSLKKSLFLDTLFNKRSNIDVQLFWNKYCLSHSYRKRNHTFYSDINTRMGQFLDLLIYCDKQKFWRWYQVRNKSFRRYKNKNTLRSDRFLYILFDSKNSIKLFTFWKRYCYFKLDSLLYVLRGHEKLYYFDGSSKIDFELRRRIDLETSIELNSPTYFKMRRRKDFESRRQINNFLSTYCSGIFDIKVNSRLDSSIYLNIYPLVDVEKIAYRNRSKNISYSKFRDTFCRNRHIDIDSKMHRVFSLFFQGIITDSSYRIIYRFLDILFDRDIKHTFNSIGFFDIYLDRKTHLYVFRKTSNKTHSKLRRCIDLVFTSKRGSDHRIILFFESLYNCKAKSLFDLFFETSILLPKWHKNTYGDYLFRLRMDSYSYLVNSKMALFIYICFFVKSEHTISCLIRILCSFFPQTSIRIGYVFKYLDKYKLHIASLLYNIKQHIHIICYYIPRTIDMYIFHIQRLIKVRIRRRIRVFSCIKYAIFFFNRFYLYFNDCYLLRRAIITLTFNDILNCHRYATVDEFQYDSAGAEPQTRYLYYSHCHYNKVSRRFCHVIPDDKVSFYIHWFFFQMKSSFTNFKWIIRDELSVFYTLKYSVTGLSSLFVAELRNENVYTVKKCKSVTRSSLVIRFQDSFAYIRKKIRVNYGLSSLLHIISSLRHNHRIGKSIPFTKAKHVNKMVLLWNILCDGRTKSRWDRFWTLFLGLNRNTNLYRKSELLRVISRSPKKKVRHKHVNWNKFLNSIMEWAAFLICSLMLLMLVFLIFFFLVVI